MILVAAAAIVVGVVALIRRGQMARLAHLGLRGAWILPVVLATQTAALYLDDGWPPRALHLATYAAMGAWVVVNRHVPWLWLIAVGGALNLIAITANGGVMPARRGAAEGAGLLDGADFVNSGVVAHPRIGILGDVFFVPKDLPLANVFSIGDVVLLIGLALLLLAATRAPSD